MNGIKRRYCTGLCSRVLRLLKRRLIQILETVSVEIDIWAKCPWTLTSANFHLNHHRCYLAHVLGEKKKDYVQGRHFVSVCPLNPEIFRSASIFQLFASGVTTANHLSPSIPNYLHVPSCSVPPSSFCFATKLICISRYYSHYMKCIKSLIKKTTTGLKTELNNFSVFYVD